MNRRGFLSRTAQVFMLALAVPWMTFYGQGGEALRGGSVCVFAAGTTRLETTWWDSDYTQPNANPVYLDWNGQARIYIKRGVRYLFVVRGIGAPFQCEQDNKKPAGKFNLYAIDGIQYYPDKGK